VTPENKASTYYPSNESQHIFIDLAVAENGGDDAITGHYSKDVFIGEVVASSTGGRHSNPEASNCLELDDGCRSWEIGVARVTGGNRAVAIKTHSPQPAPSDIQIGQVFAREARTGFYVAGAVDEEDSGRRISVGQVIVRTPADVNTGESAIPFRAVHVSGVKGVTIGSIIAEASGDESFALDSALNVSNGAKLVSVGNVVAVNWPHNNADNGTVGAVQVSSTCEDVSINSITTVDCGFRALLDTGSARASYGIVNARLTAPVAGSIAVRFFVNPLTTSTAIGPILQTGFEHGSDYESVASYANCLELSPSGQWIDGFITAGGRSSFINTRHQFISSTAEGAGDPIAYFTSGDTLSSMQVYARGAGGSFGANSANAVVKVGTADTTGRSINAGGTINASGADYAEYFELQPHLWGVVPKGALLGLDAGGLLTDRWAEIVGPVLVKS